MVVERQECQTQVPERREKKGLIKASLVERTEESGNGELSIRPVEPEMKPEQKDGRLPMEVRLCEK